MWIVWVFSLLLLNAVAYQELPDGLPDSYYEFSEDYSSLSLKIVNPFGAGVKVDAVVYCATAIQADHKELGSNVGSFGFTSSSMRGSQGRGAGAFSTCDRVSIVVSAETYDYEYVMYPIKGTIPEDPAPQYFVVDAVEFVRASNGEIVINATASFGCFEEYCWLESELAEYVVRVYAHSGDSYKAFPSVAGNLAPELFDAKFDSEDLSVYFDEDEEDEEDYPPYVEFIYGDILSAEFASFYLELEIPVKDDVKILKKLWARSVLQLENEAPYHGATYGMAQRGAPLSPQDTTGFIFPIFSNMV